MTSSTAPIIYPCDRGTGTPMGYHRYEAGSEGVVFCIHCGKRARGGNANTPKLPNVTRDNS
jgi:hypothetical protein